MELVRGAPTIGSGALCSRSRPCQRSQAIFHFGRALWGWPSAPNESYVLPRQ